MKPAASVLVVGAAVGGLSVAEALRREGYTGSIQLLGAEPHLPYDRPPLSKKVLAGEWAPSKTQLRTEAALAQLGLELVLGEPARRLDVAAREVETVAGRRLRADVIVLATGLEPRRLPGQEAWSGVHVLRTVEDAVALRADLLKGPRVVVVGDGVLGTEIAATARGLGLAVTLVGPQPGLMASQLGPMVSACLAELHAERGVTLRPGVGVAALVGEAGRVTGVRLHNGEILPAELVVVAIGAPPTLGWLAGSGLTLGDGVVCDSRCQAAENVYAVGDLACFFHEGLAMHLRLENRSNAVEQGIAVAANILGKDKPYLPVPYFWTDQFDAKIQVYGFLPAGAAMAIVDGDPARRQFVALFGQRGKIVGVVGWNMLKQARLRRQHVVDAADWATVVGAAQAQERAGS